MTSMVCYFYGGPWDGAEVRVPDIMKDYRVPTTAMPNPFSDHQDEVVPVSHLHIGLYERAGCTRFNYVGETTL